MPSLSHSSLVSPQLEALGECRCPCRFWLLPPIYPTPIQVGEVTVKLPAIWEPMTAPNSRQVSKPSYQRLAHAPRMRSDRDIRSSCKYSIYALNVSALQHRRVWILGYEIRTSAVQVAAPWQRLWLLYVACPRPAVVPNSCHFSSTSSLVTCSCFILPTQNRGAVGGRWLSIASTSYIALPGPASSWQPAIISRIPCPNRSAFDGGRVGSIWSSW